MKLAAFVLAIVALFSAVRSAWADSFLLSDGTFTTFNVPGALPNTTIAEGINNSGEIVGWFEDSAGEHGFLYANGVFTTINVPGSTGTQALGINNAGQIVGPFSTSSSGVQPQSFLYSNGAFTTVNGPPSAANGINSAGQIVGSMGIGINEQPFVYSNGHITPITLPFNNVLFSEGHGINNSGQIVGVYFANASGFLDSNGVFSSVNVPGAAGTYAYGINNSGEIVGFFADIIAISPTSSEEILQGYSDTNGVFTTIDVPAAVETIANGINGNGEIVGNFVYTATPEPTSLVLSASGLTVLGFLIRRRRRETLQE